MSKKKVPEKVITLPPQIELNKNDWTEFIVWLSDLKHYVLASDGEDSYSGKVINSIFLAALALDRKAPVKQYLSTVATVGRVGKGSGIDDLPLQQQSQRNGQW